MGNDKAERSRRPMAPLCFTPTLTAGALALACVHLVYGQVNPAGAPAPGAISTAVVEPPVVSGTEALARASFSESFLDLFRNGKINLNARLRYEYVSQEPTVPDDAHALTHTQLGLTTASLYGFQGMFEFENITAIPDQDGYRLPGAVANANRPVVADGETTELNQAWLSYSNWQSTVKGGRKRMVLDNQRFIGDVGWRQNQQTCDAVTLSSSPLPDLGLFYGYVWEVNRVFGDAAEVSEPFRDFESNSHVINLAYRTCAHARLAGDAYLLDLENDAGHGNSSVTYGFKPGWFAYV
jgi:hypothetical protein